MFPWAKKSVILSSKEELDAVGYKGEMFNSLQSLVDLANSDRESSSERVNLR